MYPLALDCGVPVYYYWDLTLQEITDIIESHGRRQKEEINRLFVLAEVISNRVGIIFSGKKDHDESDLLRPWHFYPDLFKDERATIEEPDPGEDTELQTYNMKMKLWAENWNRRNRKEKPDDTGRITSEDQG